MTATVSFADVEVGTELPPLRVPIQRVNLVMYAGASGDFNPIHWNERFAKAVGLPDFEVMPDGEVETEATIKLFVGEERYLRTAEAIALFQAQ